MCISITLSKLEKNPHPGYTRVGMCLNVLQVVIDQIQAREMS